MDSTIKFEAGEKLLCYHGPMLYEAKCLEIDDSKPERLHLLHYNGWNKNYDEWVNAKRLLKLNDKNLELQKKLVDEAAKKKKLDATPTSTNSKQPVKPSTSHNTDDSSKKAKRKPDDNQTKASTTETLKTSTLTMVTRPKKRKSSVEIEDNNEKRKTKVENKILKVIDLSKGFDQFLTNNKMKIKLPEELKEFLLDDWDQVTRQYKIIETPCKKTIVNILNEYVSYRTRLENDMSLLNRTVNSLKEYFDVMLGSQLLYKFERIQYADVLADHKNVKVSKLYGYAHLLRLIVKFEEMTAYVPLNESSLEKVIFYINDIVVYLQKHNTKYTNEVKYILASPEYVRRSLY